MRKPIDLNWMDTVTAAVAMELKNRIWFMSETSVWNMHASALYLFWSKVQ